MGERVLYIITGKVPDHSKPKRVKVELDENLEAVTVPGEAEDS